MLNYTVLPQVSSRGEMRFPKCYVHLLSLVAQRKILNVPWMSLHKMR